MMEHNLLYMENVVGQDQCSYMYICKCYGEWTIGIIVCLNSIT